MHTNVHCSTVYNSKDLEPTQMPIDVRLDKENVAHMHHGILCSNKNWWVCVLCRAWMNLETIILSKLTQEQKMKYCMFSLIGECRTMRTHGHREGSTTHWGLLWGKGEGQQGRGFGGRDHGEKCQMWVKGRRKEKHTAMCVPTQLSYMLCSCTPKPKIQ